MNSNEKRDWKEIATYCVIAFLVVRAATNEKSRKNIMERVIKPTIKKAATDIVSGVICVSAGLDNYQNEIEKT